MNDNEDRRSMFVIAYAAGAVVILLALGLLIAVLS